jgi:hypothetical protein
MTAAILCLLAGIAAVAAVRFFQGVHHWNLSGKDESRHSTKLQRELSA